MTNAESDIDTKPQTDDNSVADSFSLDSVPDDRLANIAESVRVGHGDDEMSLETVMVDLIVAHKEIEDYKQAGLSLTQALDERQTEAEAAGNDDVVAVLSEVKTAARRVYERIQFGDDNLDLENTDANSD